jgi:hypothetical protein
MGRSSTLADGQLAASAASILSSPDDGPINLICVNAGSTEETVVITFKRAGGSTARKVGRAVLTAGETLVITNFPMQNDDVLLGTTTTATTVDYLISRGSGGPLSLYTLDANGAIKNGAASIASGNQTISGDLVVSGGDLDLGSSGAAGTLDIFPTTASKGKLAVSVTDQTGDTTASLIIGAMAAARVITLADPLADADILTGKMAAVARTATATGATTGTIADAGLIQFVTVTCDDANKIIILPTPTPGRIVILDNGATGYELRSSTPTTIAINGGTGAAAESAIAASSTVIAICLSATAWKAFFLDADSDLAKVEVAAP